MSSCWVGPDQWLLMSDSKSPHETISQCDEALAGVLHLATDRSDSLSILSLTGPGVREVLAQGTGVDLLASSFSAGSCVRTRFAGVAVVIIARATRKIELILDRSYEAYMRAWLADAVETLELVYRSHDSECV